MNVTTTLSAYEAIVILIVFVGLVYVVLGTRESMLDRRVSRNNDIALKIKGNSFETRIATQLVWTQIVDVGIQFGLLLICINSGFAYPASSSRNFWLGMLTRVIVVVIALAITFRHYKLARIRDKSPDSNEVSSAKVKSENGD